MKKLLSSNKGALFTYGIILGVVTLLSCLLLIANIYEVSAILGISGVCSFFVLVIMLYANKTPNEDNTFKAGSFIGFTLLRFFLLILSIVLSGLLIFLTNDGESKKRFLYVLVSVFPILVSITIFILRGKSE